MREQAPKGVLGRVSGQDTLGQKRGNCEGRDSRSLRGQWGFRAGRVETCGSPQAPRMLRGTRKGWWPQLGMGSVHTGPLWGLALHGAQPPHGRILYFLSILMWFYFSPLAFYMTVLYVFFLELQKFCRDDLFFMLRPISQYPCSGLNSYP